NYRLTDPEGRTFVGFRNFATVLTDPVWWSDFVTTLIITVVSVVVELVLGFAFAFVMYRILFGRSLVRTGILIPYGIITVVSAFIWRYAFQLDSGFVNKWLGRGEFSGLGWARSTGLGGAGRRCLSSRCRRSGRPRRSSRCSCWPAWCRCPPS